MKGLTRHAVTVWTAVTPAGRTVSALGAASAVPALVLGWTELLAVTATSSTLMLLALLAVWSPSTLTGSVSVRPSKSVVGGSARVEVLVAAGQVPLAFPVVTLPVASTKLSARLPFIRRGRSHREALPFVAPGRGVHPVGPLEYAKTDVLGLCSRRVLLAPKQELYVRPVVTMLEPLAPGMVNDLEGTTSDHAAPSDLAFQSLREYVPGDDLRHVHWRSSAKADRLMVRQYLETRRSQVTVVLDQAAASYADEEEFELAVSVVASVAARAAFDDFNVLFAWGDTLVSSQSAEVLLDETCRVLTGETGLSDTAHRAAVAETRSSLVVVVTGSRISSAQALGATAVFPADSRRMIVRADHTASQWLAPTTGVEMLSISALKHLRPRLGMGSS